MGSGCGCLIADCSFVCQTTPHFGSTSRKASYSVRAYLTPNFPICKDPIVQFLSNKAFPLSSRATSILPKTLSSRA